VTEGLTPERVLPAWTHPVYGPWLHALGVREMSTFNATGARTFDWPPETEPQIQQVLDEMFGPDESAQTDDPLVGGNSYTKADYTAAGQLHAKDKMTIQGIEKRTTLKRKRAYRIYRQFEAGAVLYDDAGLHPGPGYRWDPFELENDPPGYKLIHG
jgi:hypothetical protein